MMNDSENETEARQKYLQNNRTACEVNGKGVENEVRPETPDTEQTKENELQNEKEEETKNEVKLEIEANFKVEVPSGKMCKSDEVPDANGKAKELKTKENNLKEEMENDVKPKIETDSQNEVISDKKCKRDEMSDTVRKEGELKTKESDLREKKMINDVKQETKGNIQNEVSSSREDTKEKTESLETKENDFRNDEEGKMNENDVKSEIGKVLPNAASQSEETVNGQCIGGKRENGMKKTPTDKTVPKSKVAPAQQTQLAEEWPRKPNPKSRRRSKYSKLKLRKVWLDDECMLEIKFKDMLRKKMIESSKDEDLKNYRFQRAKVSRLCREKKRIYMEMCGIDETNYEEVVVEKRMRIARRDNEISAGEEEGEIENDTVDNESNIKEDAQSDKGKPTVAIGKGWLDEECLKEIKLKDKLRSKMLKTQAEEDIESYKDQRRKVNRLCRSKKRTYGAAPYEDVVEPIQDLTSTSTGFTKGKNKKQKGWMDEECVQEINLKEALKQKMEQSGTEEDAINYRIQRRKVKLMCQAKQREHFANMKKCPIEKY